MQFQVPQFIEVEDKIFGPFTFKQFIYMAGGAGICYLLWRVMPLYIALPLMGLAGGAAAALGFVEYNGRPFIVALEYAFYYLVHPKLYLWNNVRKKKRDDGQRARDKSKGADILYVPRLSDSKLHELAWSLDIKERIAAGTADDSERSGRTEIEDVMRAVHTAREARV